MLQAIDLFVIIAYLVGTASLGIYMSGRKTSTKDYFLGDRKLPRWAVRLSVASSGKKLRAEQRVAFWFDRDGGGPILDHVPFEWLDHEVAGEPELIMQ